MNVDEYMSRDATALAALVASKQVTPTELLALARERASAVDGTLNSIVSLVADADEQVMGDFPSGPLAGVPFLLKDLGQEYAGSPTSCGSRSLVGDVADTHSLYTRRLLDAGLVIFGKTNTPELGAKGITESELWGPARNPWDVSRTPGGSSGGSAAAVAAGIVPAAGANDGGGSIRIPAACTGLVGHKPSRGLTPYGPQSAEPMFGMAIQGVVSRTVRDSAAFLDALVGHDPRLSYLGDVPADSFVERIVQPSSVRKIGFCTSSAINPNPDPEAVAAVRNTAELLQELGHSVEEVPVPYDDAALTQDFLAIWFGHLSSQVADIKARTGARSSDFEADTIALAELGRARGLHTMTTAIANVNDHIQSLATFHESYDFLLTPTLATLPPRVGAMTTPSPLQSISRVMSRVGAGRLLSVGGLLDDRVTANLGWVPYTQLANLTGRPATSVPVHWTGDGLPLGVQFVGPLGSDGALLHLAAQLEEARPWMQRFPAYTA